MLKDTDLRIANNTIVIITGSNSTITQSKFTTFTAGTVAIIIPVFIG